MFRRECTIVKEGEDATRIFFLRRGAVEVLVGGRKVLELRDGSVFGETAFLTDGTGKNTSTVRALEVCDCRTIPQQTLARCLHKYPKERDAFVQMALHRAGLLNVNQAMGERSVNPRPCLRGARPS